MMGLRCSILLFIILSSLVQSQTIYDQLNEHTHQDCDIFSIQQELRKGFIDLQQKVDNLQSPPTETFTSRYYFFLVSIASYCDVNL